MYHLTTYIYWTHLVDLSVIRDYLFVAHEITLCDTIHAKLVGFTLPSCHVLSHIRGIQNYSVYSRSFSLAVPNLACSHDLVLYLILRAFFSSLSLCATCVLSRSRLVSCFVY